MEERRIGGVDELMAAVREASETAVPKFRIHSNSKYCVQWWDDEVAGEIAARRSALSIYKNSPTLENYLRFRNQVAKTRLKSKEVLRAACCKWGSHRL